MGIGTAGRSTGGGKPDAKQGEQCYGHVPRPAWMLARMMAPQTEETIHSFMRKCEH
ncbi:MAG: hypothetical protein AAF329_02605 [Cyanobacteria bacterium P01_A01_bin.17]